jgi:hypothetical protein
LKKIVVFRKRINELSVHILSKYLEVKKIFLAAIEKLCHGLMVRWFCCLGVLEGNEMVLEGNERRGRS